MARTTLTGATEIVVGVGLPHPILPFREDRAMVAVLTQPAATQHAGEVADALRDEGYGVEVIGLPDRDQAKTLDVAATVYDTLGRIGLTRDDTIVGVGGGSVTDLAGFVAGTWLRGVEAAYVPTTFLGAVDAAIGGKTGVNAGGKNQVGVFWSPIRVIVDTETLRRLPTSLLREGHAEAFKAGLVGDPELVAIFAANGTAAPLEEVVTRAIAVKTRLVELDPLDRAERAYLNFGHTIGHAVEYASPLSHGESVAVGMVAAARISEAVAGFGDTAQVVDALQELGLPTSVEGLPRARVKDLLGRDKKRDHAGIRMVLLRAVGEPFLTHVDMKDIDIGLAAIGL